MNTDNEVDEAHGMAAIEEYCESKESKVVWEVDLGVPIGWSMSEYEDSSLGPVRGTKSKPSYKCETARSLIESASSSGTGLGYTDAQAEFDSEEEARAQYACLKVYFITEKLPFKDIDGTIIKEEDVVIEEDENIAYLSLTRIDWADPSGL